MEKDFGADFSKVEERNRNTDEFVACATGTNVFFGKNVLQNSSLKNEVIAHEYAHVLQQQAVPVAEDAKRSVQQTVPEGVVQGFGGMDWVKNVFKRKPKQPSAPEKKTKNGGLFSWVKNIFNRKKDAETVASETVTPEIDDELKFSDEIINSIAEKILNEILAEANKK